MYVGGVGRRSLKPSVARLGQVEWTEQHVGAATASDEGRRRRHRVRRLRFRVERRRVGRRAGGRHHRQHHRRSGRRRIFATGRQPTHERRVVLEALA